MTHEATEDFYDSDGRRYRVGFYRGLWGRCRAYALQVPWPRQRIDAFTVHQRHLYSDGEICLSSQPIRQLDAARRRARLWCEAFSHTMEHGYEATRRALPEWG